MLVLETHRTHFVVSKNLYSCFALEDVWLGSLEKDLREFLRFHIVRNRTVGEEELGRGLLREEGAFDMNLL